MKSLTRIAIWALYVLALGDLSALAEDARLTDGLSRITIATPLFTRHIPHDSAFNDDNWGAFVLFAIDPDWSLAGGDFINSYDRNTAFVAGAWYPLHWHVSRLTIDPGIMAA